MKKSLMKKSKDKRLEGFELKKKSLLKNFKKNRGSKEA